MQQLKGRVAVVTGASSGIGRATAVLLAERGCTLALVDIDGEGLEETAERVETRGVSASRHVLDVADAARLAELPAEVVAAHGHVHILVNNAGVSALKTFEEHTVEDFRWVVGINFWGVVLGCKFFLPELRRADEAHIVNVSSVFGFIGVPGQTSYCATKFAVRGFSEALWVELRGTTVGVTSIHPGGIKTNIARRARAESEDSRDRVQQTFDRFGHPPERVANAILRGIERRKLRVIVGPEAYAIEWLKRLMPVQLHRVVSRANPAS